MKNALNYTLKKLAQKYPPQNNPPEKKPAFPGEDFPPDKEMPDTPHPDEPPVQICDMAYALNLLFLTI